MMTVLRAVGDERKLVVSFESWVCSAELLSTGHVDVRWQMPPEAP